MCTVSDKLKLCTCKNDTSMFKDFWVLYRVVEGKRMMTIGEPAMPAIIDPAKDKYNQALLLQLLNNGNAFDEPLYPIDKDLLQISFTTTENTFLNYGFVFENDQWAVTDVDIFSWSGTHDAIKEGEVTVSK